MSFWHPYICSLPQPPSLASSTVSTLSIPTSWPAEDRLFLSGTNLEPAIAKRQDLWREEWERGIELLGDEGREYGWELYQWAATVFGSRSFRASLVVDENLLADNKIRESVKRDQFAVLMPILDIGNHNGVNNAVWRPDKDQGKYYSPWENYLVLLQDMA